MNTLTFHPTWTRLNCHLWHSPVFLITHISLLDFDSTGGCVKICFNLSPCRLYLTKLYAPPMITIVNSGKTAIFPQWTALYGSLRMVMCRWETVLKSPPPQTSKRFWLCLMYFVDHHRKMRLRTIGCSSTTVTSGNASRKRFKKIWRTERYWYRSLWRCLRGSGEQH